MQIHETSRRTFSAVILLAVVGAAAVIIAFALIARANVNLSAALTDKPDIAVLLLLQEDGVAVTNAELLRDLGQERDYLLETENGPMFAKLRKVDGKWQLAEQTSLRE